MGLFDLFRSREDREKLSHLRNLIVLAMADGKVEKAELAAIAAMCSREGLTEKDFNKCIDDPKSIDFVVPSDDYVKLQHLRDMVLLMMCDGNINDEEMKVCKAAADALGFKTEIIDALIKDIIDEIRNSK